MCPTPASKTRPARPSLDATAGRTAPTTVHPARSGCASEDQNHEHRSRDPDHGDPP
jgi:hypothetical protein